MILRQIPGGRTLRAENRPAATRLPGNLRGPAGASDFS